ncbi:MAG: transglycosylase SLT domain-containing protein, partial [Rhodospirillaceae bacterium]
WRRRNNLASGALELHLGDAAQPGVTQTGNQKAWWTERAILARAAIRRGDYRTAYRLASGHGSTHSGSRAEAEWIAGWVALRFQKQPDTAFKHFTTLFENVSTPISLSRGAYWAGRSLAAKGDTAGAEAWYRKAAQYPNAFYGQLAIDHLGESLSNYWPKTDVVPTAEDYAAVAADSRAQTAARLAQTGRNQELLSFLLKLEADVESPGARVLIGDIALREGHLGEAVFYARRAALDGTLLLAAGYPMDPDLTAALIEASAENGLEPALVMGLIRQESNFNPIVVSPAGARGLMQIMPATAQIVARQVKLPYSRDKLTADPSFNIVLGTKYLGDLMKQFGGSEILSAAGYNAGPGRPIQWMDRNGDPRRAQVDTLDWIEKIPFNETRNYVQRVLEGMWAFRQRLGSPEALQPATADF